MRQRGGEYFDDNVYRYTPIHELGIKSAQEYSEEFAASARREVDSDEPTLENLQSMLLLSMTYYAMGYGKKSFMQMGMFSTLPHSMWRHTDINQAPRFE